MDHVLLQLAQYIVTHRTVSASPLEWNWTTFVLSSYAYSVSACVITQHGQGEARVLFGEENALPAVTVNALTTPTGNASCSCL